MISTGVFGPTATGAVQEEAVVWQTNAPFTVTS